MSKRKKLDFRDVCLPLKILRDFLLGRAHQLHCRFPPLIAPRTIPTPEVPRGPEYKYSNNYYCNRSARDSVMPPVIAPVALGPSFPTVHGTSGGSMTKRFDFPPTPGPTWWWDGHCYVECAPDVPPRCPEPPPPPPPPKPKCPPPCPPPPDPCACK